MKRLVMLLLALLPLTAAAQAVPTQIAFTGRLAQSGTVANGNHAFIFDLFNDPTAGSSVWSESFAALPVTEGVVSLNLGTTMPLSSSVFTGSPLYLQITVDGTAMTPRLLIVSAPYAFRADVAETANRIGTTLASDVVSQVTQGAGITVNRAGQNVTVSADPTALQSRVTGTCMAGQAIATIAQNGTVTCQATGITGVTAGNGLTGGGTSGSPKLDVDATVMQSRVTGTCGAGQAIATIAQNGTVTCQTVPTAPFNLTSQVTGVLPIANGGTGSATLNFVDLATNQAIAGQKSFSGRVLATQTPGGSGAALASFIVNPASANATDALVGLMVGGVSKATIDASGNVNASSYRYTTPVTRTYSILSNEFTPLNSGVAYTGNGSFRSVTTAGLQTLLAPMHLPQGAFVQNVSCYVEDNSATANIVMDTGYVDPTSLFTQYPTASTSVSGAGTGTVTLLPPVGYVIDNANAYFVRFDVSDGACSTNCQIRSCAVTYTESQAQ